MNRFLELAEKVEALTGPCRETDAAIMRAAMNAEVWSYHNNCHIDANISKGLWSGRRENHPDYYAEGDEIVTWRFRIGDGKEAVYGEVPAYTDSFKAAMTLVPEGWQPEQLTWEAEIGGNVAASIGNFGEGDSYCSGMSALCETPELALTAAALRAHAAIEGAKP